MSEFRFAEPIFAHGLWAVVLLVGLLLWLDRRGGSALTGLVGSALQERLVHRPGNLRRSLRVVLLGLAAAAAVLALMRPQWGMRVISTSRVGAQIMVALDVSRSMLAEDVAPNRLARAKAEIVDLLSYMKGDQVGLIAFAGRASVVSPMTPDFGFLRLVLANTGPGTVTRGGTRLAEPIRKAVAGFGPTGGASRAILLITDGEDHDSFALDAAKEAAEAGIKIIAIGFGDEAGSEIQVTDPRTGARTTVRDADGRPVKSRLDGEMLRELALATGGAYVPAGTGVLDLESIYEEHIARLTRGELDGQRTVRDEGYPWFVLMALVFLFSSVAVSAGSLGARGAGVLLFALFATTQAPPALAQGVTPGAPLVSVDPSEVDPPVATTAAGSASEQPEDPREVYNRGVAALESRDLEDAERLLSRARRDAHGDDELRYHAAYNLGWATVQQAGRIEGESPQDALKKLHRAADWFREAVRLRPDEDAARRNLEVTLKRALVLADNMARRGSSGIDGELRALAEAQRGLLAGVAGLLEQGSSEDLTGVGARSPRRDAFRARATEQRTVLSDADQLAIRVAEERDAIEARDDEERTPEDRMRAVQLANVQQYLHRGREKMGQARRQLRGRRDARAYRRSSGALMELKRALDQLREPVEVLDQLLRESAEVARGTALLAASRSVIPGLAAAVPKPPAWLTLEGLEDEQLTLAARIEELHGRLLAGLEQAGAGAALPPEQVELLAAVREAEPFVATGAQRSLEAAEQLAATALENAPEPQRLALVSLGSARERFLDLRGLIETTHADEKRLAELFATEAMQDPATQDEFLPALRALQLANLDRGERLGAMLDKEIGKHQQALIDAGAGVDPQGPAGAPPVDPAVHQAELERLDVATQLLTLVLASMDSVRAGLGDEGSPHAADWPGATESAAQAAAHLQSLRQLFFSIVEHVRELGQRQVDLADETQDAIALAAGSQRTPEAERRSASLGPRERELASDALSIANALAEQSENAAANAEDPQADEATQQLRAAGEHVLLAEGEMERAATQMDQSDLERARELEVAALTELQKALELLDPPKPPGEQGDSEQQQDQQDQQEQDQQEDQQGEQPEEQEASEQPDPNADPAQLLQEVRDREAQRRRDRARKQAGYETVEKDW